MEIYANGRFILYLQSFLIYLFREISWDVSICGFSVVVAPW